MARAAVAGELAGFASLGPGYLERATYAEIPRPGRNDPCWCDAGVKFKRCHGK